MSLVYEDHGREVFACRDVDLEVGANQFVGVLGPSGSGKSSLLYLLSGLKDPSLGRVLYGGNDYSQMTEGERGELRLRKFGFVFQQPFLLGYLSVIENVVLAGANSRGRALDLLDRVGLREKAHRMPSALSGGEKQRACVARALYTEPEVIFADEPTASLDHTTGENVIDLLRTLRKGALVVVTHDPSMLEDANRVLRMEEGVVTEVV
ncbi:MAG: ATP-binding cassette domain-containing protein [Armatimonadetes bacterium]|nr:ATP-binding cassette domain-containing protein [Armatimonadota bacterium]